MNLTDLKLNDAAEIVSNLLGIDYKFSGHVEKCSDRRLWLTNRKNQGYIINKKFNKIWNVKKYANQ